MGVRSARAGSSCTVATRYPVEEVSEIRAIAMQCVHKFVPHEPGEYDTLVCGQRAKKRDDVNECIPADTGDEHVTYR